MAIQIVRVFTFEKKSGAVPLWRRGSNRRRGFVWEAANLWDGRGEELEGYAKGEMAIWTRLGVRQEELPCRQDLWGSVLYSQRKVDD